jgi:hypothetical protein
VSTNGKATLLFKVRSIVKGPTDLLPGHRAQGELETPNDVETRVNTSNPRSMCMEASVWEVRRQPLFYTMFTNGQVTNGI